MSYGFWYAALLVLVQLFTNTAKCSKDNVKNEVLWLGRRPASSTLILLMLIFFISYLALTCAPYNHDQVLKVPQLRVDKAVVFASFVFNPRENAASTLLNQTSRMTVFNFIKDNPGLHFRAISDCLRMPIGVLQYHLGLLVNGGLIFAYRDGRYKRFFESKKFTDKEMETISALRHKVSGMILIALLKKPQMTHRDLAKQLNISSQALSWHMKQLEKVNFIERNADGLNVTYSLDEATQRIVDRCATFLVGTAGRTHSRNSHSKGISMF